MKRQLIFLFLTLALIVSKLLGLLGLGWMIACLVILLLLWYPLRFSCDFLVGQQISVTCYILPFPGVKTEIFATTKTISWWKDVLTGLDKMREKKHGQTDSDSAAKKPLTEESGVAAKKDKDWLEKFPVTSQLIGKALGALRIEKLEISLVLGGSPMVAALAGGGIRTVIGWVLGIISYQVARFPEPKINIGLDPDGSLLSGNGSAQIRTDLAALFMVGFFFLKEMIGRKKNGGKRNRKLVADSHGQSPANGGC